VYAVNAPAGISWANMRDEHKMKIAPRGRVFLPASIRNQIPWDSQTKLR
jgi:hypothetical protein